jgi:benzylsuccinate CoA-transferase BbsF subunit
VESRARPDLFRMSGTALGLSGPGFVSTPSGVSPIFHGLNYSKKGVTINLTKPEGRELALRLIRISDVVTENFATGVMERLGLGYAYLRTIKPDLIMLSGSTLGTTGPEREATGWGPNVASYAGLPFITGYENGPPSDLGGTWPDYMVGTMMVFALLSALHHRRRTGEGQHIEIAMGEVVTAMIPEAILEYTINGRQPPRRGNRDTTMVPHNVYPCAGEDKWVAIAVANDEEWRALCRAMGEPAWTTDPRFADVLGRHRHQEELDQRLAEWTRQHTPYDIMHRLQAAGVAAGPVMNIYDLLEDPHLSKRGFLVEIEHPDLGPRTVAGLPVHFSAMPQLDYFRAPILGEHNDYVFGELLGLSQDEIQRLQEEKVIW